MQKLEFKDKKEAMMMMKIMRIIRLEGHKAKAKIRINKMMK